MAVIKEELFYVWVTLMMESQADRLVGALVRLGHQVGPLSAAKSLTLTRNTFSSLMALTVTTGWSKEPEKDQSSKHRLIADVKTSLTKIGARWHSVIVVHGGPDCTWDAGEIPLPPTPPTAHERIAGED